MSLKKLDINETELVVGGMSNSTIYTILGLVSLCLCSFTGLILKKTTDSKVIGAVSGHLANQFVPKLIGASTADLFIKAYNFSLEEAAEEMVDEGVSLTF